LQHRKKLQFPMMLQTRFYREAKIALNKRVFGKVLRTDKLEVKNGTLIECHF